MIHAEAVEPGNNDSPIIVLQGKAELDTAARAILLSDPELATTLYGLSEAVHNRGWNSESTRFVGHAALTIRSGLEQLGRQLGLHGVHAAIMLEEATFVPLPTEDIPREALLPVSNNISSPVPVIVAAPITDPEASVCFTPQEEWLAEAHSAPLEIH